MCKRDKLGPWFRKRFKQSGIPVPPLQTFVADREYSSEYSMVADTQDDDDGVPMSASGNQAKSGGPVMDSYPSAHSH